MKIRFLFPALCTLLLVSCGTLNTLSVDQLYPAEVTFPKEINNIAVVNNSIPVAEFGTKILTIGTLEGNGKQLAENLSGLIADNNYFSQVMICDSALQQYASYKDRLIPKDELNSLFWGFNSDLILSVDRFSVRTSRDQMYYPGFNQPFPFIRADVNTLVRLYVPNRNTPMASVAITDSLFWDLDAGISDDVIMKEAAIVAATSATARIAPQWKSIDRLYFDGYSPEIRDGALYLRENKPHSALEIWEAFYNRLKKGKLKARTAYNIALACELTGDVPVALSWLDKAEKFAKDGSDEKRLIFIYRDVLTKRKSDVVKLNLQMQKFD